MTMYFVLPPSETKHVGGSQPPLALDRLSNAHALTDARSATLAEIEAVSNDAENAAKVLKLGVKARADIQHNQVLRSSPTMPAIERYTGVLYDSLNVADLPKQARGWINQHVFVQSALFGLVRATDLIPAYRLSASSRVKPASQSLKQLWQHAHSAIEWDSDELILDLRSQDYAGLAPIAGSIKLEVVEEQEDGTTKALNHFNKAGKGRLLRQLALSNAKIGSIEELISWGTRHDTQLYSDSPGTVVLVAGR